MRIARHVEEGEVVLNMFAGVGSFSIIIARHANPRRVYSVDINPVAIRYLDENVRLNRAYGKVIPIHGDAKEVIEKKLRHVADRVIMPLPEKAFDYLPHAILSLGNAGKWIHYYDFTHAKKNEDPVETVKLKVTRRLKVFYEAFEIPFGRVVRTTGPNWYQVVLDIKTLSINTKHGHTN